MNPKRVGGFNRKENSGLTVLQGRVENFFKRKPNSDVSQTLSNERNHKKKWNPEKKCKLSLMIVSLTKKYILQWYLKVKSISMIIKQLEQDDKKKSTFVIGKVGKSCLAY